MGTVRNRPALPVLVADPRIVTPARAEQSTMPCRAARRGEER